MSLVYESPPTEYLCNLTPSSPQNIDINYSNKGQVQDADSYQIAQMACRD